MPEEAVLKESDVPEDEESSDSETGATRRRRRTTRPFPASSYKDAAKLAEAMVEIAGGAREVRRITLFDHLGRSPESGDSRQAVTNSSRYGLTEGGYQAETLKLTDDGLAAVNPDTTPRDRVRAEFRLAIEGIESFKALYERFAGNKLPSQQVMRDFLIDELGLSDEHALEAVELFIVNAREIGLLRTLSGAERILTLDHVLDLLPSAGEVAKTRDFNEDREETTLRPSLPTSTSLSELATSCFYITPIGEEGSDERKHADLVLSQIVEPAIEALGLSLVVVRAESPWV